MILTPNFWLDSVYRECDKLVSLLSNEYTEAREERAFDKVLI